MFTYPDGFTVHPKLLKVLGTRQKLWEEGQADWAMGEAARLRHDARSRVTTCGSPGRTPGGARSATATPCSSTTRPASSTCRSTTSVPSRDGSSSTTRCSASTRRSGSSTATRSVHRHAFVAWEAQFGDFAQRRADHHRPVHRCRRGQVGADERPRAAAAARLRGSGAGALERPDGALPHAVRRGEHAGRQRHDRGAAVPRPPPPGRARAAEAARSCSRRRRSSVAGRLSAGRGVQLGPVPRGDRRRSVDRPVTRSERSSWPPARSSLEALGERDKAGIDDIAVVRVEQLYPFPRTSSASAVARYEQAEEVCWLQEEPENMGAWPARRVAPLRKLVGPTTPCHHVSRDESGSPAAGSKEAQRAREGPPPRHRPDHRLTPAARASRSVVTVGTGWTARSACRGELPGQLSLRWRGGLPGQVPAGSGREGAALGQQPADVPDRPVGPTTTAPTRRGSTATPIPAEAACGCPSGPSG